MKRTRNMYYKETVESRELTLYAENDSRIYHSNIVPVIENLTRKYKKGIYDSEKAVDLWFYVATAASEKYFKEFGYKFSVQERFSAEVEFEKDFLETIEFNVNERNA